MSDLKKRRVIIFDIDGVLADASHRIHYIDGNASQKDWSAFYEACDDDEPIKANVAMLTMLLRVSQIEREPPDYCEPCTQCDGKSTRTCKEERELDEAEDSIVVLMTGRPETLRKKTQLWLLNKCNLIPVIPILMRKEGDYRPDYVVKKELAEKHIGLNNILCVYEDRDQVVKMWRENGIQCYQTCEGTY